MIGVTMSAVEATVVSLALYASAYFAEIFRTAWASVPRRASSAKRPPRSA
jgi:polar amino acid transport system permease protein